MGVFKSIREIICECKYLYMYTDEYTVKYKSYIYLNSSPPFGHLLLVSSCEKRNTGLS